MKLLIKNGRVIDPDTGKDGIYDVLTEDGKILRVAQDIEEEAGRVVDAEGLYVMPGIIDLHVHLRDPGLEYKETLYTGGLAAARGGVTTMCAMPNTIPVTDSPEMIRSQTLRAAAECPVHVSFIGAVTKGQQGAEITDIAGMKKEGMAFISEDGKSVMDAGLYRDAMKTAACEGVTVLAHCEDKNMVAGGVMNECEKSREMGLPGITNGVEDVIVARDILIAKETGAKLHLCHCSTKDSVEMIRLAKEAGLPVTAEVCPHHFTLTSGDIPEDDANYKMNPPLREKEDVDALIDGLKRGIIDVIATDHAPHGEEEKAKGFAGAPFGIVGLETSVAVTMTELVHKGILTPMEMAERMSHAPARILGVDKGSLAEGKCADIVLIDPDREYVINKEDFVSKGKNTPFDGKKVKGQVVMTIVDGAVVYEAE
ncbi:dihydroorotase [Lacrimispora sp. NSJ-141]|uniref:Dihydroorotase n=1 Tax=Lientehia hominis TaxID=2897778 RepID=A0AAP2W7V0_9FIRM|nr:dihydroorotase [Lientehia hominis]MCD2492823.1 dihydroorotase [Lientehia hominis]